MSDTQDNQPNKKRRGFLIALWGGVAAALAVLFSASSRFLFPNVVPNKSKRFRLAQAKDYRKDHVDTRHKEDLKFFILRDEKGIAAIRAQCTHLGCVPYWFPNEGIFKCPCHGSGFDMQGLNIEGPAPRPLERFHVEIDEKGFLIVDTSKKYFFEKGEWDNPNAVVKVL
jgi:cytochrome b6-f complex iron-sulfur subunit